MERGYPGLGKTADIAILGVKKCVQDQGLSALSGSNKSAPETKVGLSFTITRLYDEAVQAGPGTYVLKEASRRTHANPHTVCRHILRADGELQSLDQQEVAVYMK